jgi:cysteine desulfurase
MEAERYIETIPPKAIFSTMTSVPIYLDNQATTPLAPEAREAMLHWLSGPESPGFANPHSMHKPGRAAAAAVEVAREQVASLLPKGGRVIFTSGATEAINQAILAVPRAEGLNGIAYSAIEHSAVVNSAVASGDPMQELPVGADGVVDPEVDFAEGTGLVSVMQVNNEIGTIQPVARLAERAHEAGALFLCDAVQGAGKLAPPVGADLIAVTAHKLYGPKGIGALWVRDGVKVGPLMHGGGQEGGLRSGTLSPALCAGFGAAAALASSRMDQDFQHLSGLAALARSILSRWALNGSETARWPGNLNLRLDGLNFPRLMSDCRQIAFSAGSACGSGTGKPSRVLTAIGLEAQQSRNAIRLGFGRYTTREEVETACRTIDAAAVAQGA